MRYIKPSIIFLDDDLSLSSQYLTNKFLNSNIRSCSQTLLCSLFYFKGIRSERIFKHYFSKDNKDESTEKFIPTYPLKKISFTRANSQETKWCRKCQEHIDYLMTYLEIMLDEWEYRTGREHDVAEMLDFLRMSFMSLKIPKANIKKLILPYKNLPLKYRKRVLVDGYRAWYNSQLLDPMAEYVGSRRDIPEFVLKGRTLMGENIGTVMI